MRLLRSHIFQFLCILLPVVIALQGCGSADRHPTSVPDGSTITINPSTVTLSKVDNTSKDFQVTVKDPNGVPINKAQVRITGAFAQPRNATNTTARYQFYRSPGGEVNPGNIPVDSGFTAETDSNGVYIFSITIYGLVGGIPNAFTDNIDIDSGTAFVTATLTIS